MAKAVVGQVRYWVPSPKFETQYAERLAEKNLLVILEVRESTVVYKFQKGGSPRMALRDLFEAMTDVYF